MFTERRNLKEETLAILIKQWNFLRRVIKSFAYFKQSQNIFISYIGIIKNVTVF
jgi:hypothetical protein